MKILIDLPEEVYNEIKSTDRIILGTRSGKSFAYALWNSVKNGILVDDFMKEVIIWLKQLWKQ